jgi:hypothetical protein
LCYYTAEMACPWFEPVSPGSSLAGASGAMLPLGDAWIGECAAGGRPDSHTVRSVCNLGYPAGRCPHFPSGAGPDAVRFVIRRDDGNQVSLYYAVERDHLPFAHGPLEYSRASGSVLGTLPDARLARQAAAYVQAYLRRKMAAARPLPASQ